MTTAKGYRIHTQDLLRWIEREQALIQTVENSDTLAGKMYAHGVIQTLDKLRAVIAERKANDWQK